MSIFDQYPCLLDEGYVENYNLDSCHTAMSPDAHFSTLDVAVALKRASGNISSAAKMLMRSRRSLEGFVLRTIELKDLMEDINEEFLDTVEDLYKKDAILGDGTARRFFLTTKGKDRGFTVRNEVSGKNGDPIEHTETSARDVLASRVALILERTAAARNAGGVDGSGSGSASVGMEDVGEAVSTSSAGQDVADVADSGGPGLREDQNGG